MNVRMQTTAILGLTLLGLVSVMYIVSRTVLGSSFDELDDESARVNITRALDALAVEISAIDTFVFDWAFWDDTYAFIEDENVEYVESNLVDEMFAVTPLGLMLFINSDGRIIWGKTAASGDERPTTSLPDELVNLLEPDSILLRHPDTASVVKGIVRLPVAPMLLSSRPIITSDLQGPVRGTIIMGRYLTPERIKLLAETTYLSLSVREIADPELPSDFTEALSAMSHEERIFVRALDSDSIAGYGLVTDVFGEPALAIRADMPRDIHSEGQATVRYLVVSILLAGLAFSLVTFLLIEKLILSRLSRLSLEVKRVASTDLPTARLSLSGPREVARVADGINSMLGRLEELHSEVVETERLRGKEAEAAARTEELERSRKRILEVSESLRRELAVHLHGSVQNKLILVLGKISRLDVGSRGGLATDVAEIRSELEEIIENDVRKISVQIHPDILRRGLVPALESLGDRFRRELAVENDFDQDIVRSERTESETIPEKVRLSAYRIAEEALTNAVKHAQATKVKVALDRRSDGWLQLKVSDDGRGFEVDSESGGLGIGTMRDYAEALSGRIEIESNRGCGTAVTVKLPMTV